MEPIKPLERIDDNWTVPQLEYVWKFCNEYDVKKKPFWEEENKGRVCYIHFVDRYNEGEVQLGWSFEEYDNDKYVNVILRLYGMDKEKMWYLLLFFSDFSHGEGLGVDGEDPKDERNFFFEAMRTYFGRNKMKITLDIEGVRKKLYIKNPFNLWLLTGLAYSVSDTDKVKEFVKDVFKEVRQRHHELVIAMVSVLESEGRLLIVNEKESMTVTRWYFYQMLHVFLESFGTPDGDKSQQINDLCKEFSLTGRERLTLQTDMNGFIDTMAEVMKLKNSASPLRTQINGANINRHYYIWHQTAEIATEREE